LAQNFLTTSRRSRKIARLLRHAYQRIENPMLAIILSVVIDLNYCSRSLAVTCGKRVFISRNLCKTDTGLL